MEEVRMEEARIEEARKEMRRIQEGDRYGRLTVIEVRKVGECTVLRCRCDCGNVRKFRPSQWGKNISCGECRVYIIDKANFDPAKYVPKNNFPLRELENSPVKPTRLREGKPSLARINKVPVPEPSAPLRHMQVPCGIAIEAIGRCNGYDTCPFYLTCLETFANEEWLGWVVIPAVY